MRYGLIGFQVLLWNGTYLLVSWLLTLPGRHRLQARYGNARKKWKPDWRVIFLITACVAAFHCDWDFILEVLKK